MSEDLIIDPSMLIQAYIVDPYSKRVHTLLRYVARGLYKLHAPEFCLLECTNILWKRAVFKHLPLQDCQLALQELRQLPLVVYEAKPLLERALELGITYRIAIYDMVYIALAEQLHMPLITDDGKQSDIAKELGLAVKPITDFPEYQP